MENSIRFLPTTDTVNQLLVNSSFTPQYYVVHSYIKLELNREMLYEPKEILTGPLKNYLCATGDPSALADVMNKALTHYPDINHLPIFDEVSVDKVAKRYLMLAD